MTRHVVRLFLHASAATTLILLGWSPSLAAQGPTGKLEGVVRDSLSRRPLVEARIEIRGTAFTARTDSSGYYFINGIPAGTHDVRVTAPGHRGTELQGVRIRSGDTITQDITLSTQPGPGIRSRDASGLVRTWIDGVVVARNQLAPGEKHREFVLIDGAYTDRVPVTGQGIVRGTIRDDRHQPIANARVTIVGTDLVTMTDTAGRYRFELVPAGRYDVRAAFPGHRDTEIQGLRVMSRQTVTQDFTLKARTAEIDDP